MFYNSFLKMALTAVLTLLEQIVSLAEVVKLR